MNAREKVARLHYAPYDMECLQIVSFNCSSIKSSVGAIQSLCKDYDVILLQETWLLDTELDMLNSTDKYCYGQGTPSVDLTAGIVRGRPYAGLAVLYRKTLGSLVRFRLELSEQ